MRISFLMAVSRAAFCALVFSGCASFGPGRVAPDRFSYSDAISDSWKQQLVVNLVRMRYGDMPVFLDIASVVTSYSFNASASLSGTGGSDSSGTATANAGYIENPTITYTPLRGKDFSERMLEPIAPPTPFVLGNVGWPDALPLRMCVRRVNGIDSTPVSYHGTAEAIEMRKRFERVCDLWGEMNDYGATAFEAEEDEKNVIYRVRFLPEKLGDEIGLLVELKSLLELDPDENRFRVTTHSQPREPDEIQITPRSLLEAMMFLAQGVSVPADLADNAPVFDMTTRPEGPGRAPLIEVRSQREEPDNAFAAAPWRGYWFFIDDTDTQSKSAFTLFGVLFSLQSIEPQSQLPVLTIPTR